MLIVTTSYQKQRSSDYKLFLIVGFGHTLIIRCEITQDFRRFRRRPFVRNDCAAIIGSGRSAVFPAIRRTSIASFSHYFTFHQYISLPYLLLIVHIMHTIIPRTEKKNPDENVRVLQSQAIKLKYSWSID